MLGFETFLKMMPKATLKGKFVEYAPKMIADLYAALSRRYGTEALYRIEKNEVGHYWFCVYLFNESETLITLDEVHRVNVTFWIQSISDMTVEEIEESFAMEAMLKDLFN